ncbi:MAG: 23S rRNA (guanine745-N1)-methyltransferase [Halieaceae bacterium]|jgi:23S rRNA (guanine745-N1)-methyltransferase
MWICPVCRQTLSPEQEISLICPDGHSYDLAREGYVNLLQANRKNSPLPGDSKEMIAARRRVHNTGLYQPLALAIQEQLTFLTNPSPRILDLGCGEGHYCGSIQQALPAASVFGVDISKAAVKLAAKSCPKGSFAVSSVFDVPLPDSSVDLVTSVFAPVDGRELSRLLKPEGLYLKVTPAPRHLWELRCLLYNHPKPHESDSPLIPGFESLVEADLDYTQDMSGAVLRDLVCMTPYAHRGQRENREKLDKLREIRLQMNFHISLQRYNSNVEIEATAPLIEAPCLE